MKRWNPTVEGEQVFCFTISYVAKGSCYSDPGRISGPPEDCYPPEGEAEITELVCTITDNDGAVVPNDSELGKLLIALLPRASIEDELFETEANDYLEDRRDYREDR